MAITFTVSDANNSKIGTKYVIGKSKLRVTITNFDIPSGKKVKTINLVMDGIQYEFSNAKSVITSDTVCSGNGNLVAIKIVYSDSSEKGAETTISFTTYEKPSLSLSLSRYSKNSSGQYVKNEEGGYGKVSYTATYSSAGGQNSINVSIDYSNRAGTDTGHYESVNSTWTMYVPCDLYDVYTFEFTITDALTTKTYVKMLSTAVTPFEVLKGGLGFAVGGIATLTRVFEVFWSTKIHGSLKVDNPVYDNYGGERFQLSSGSDWSYICDFPELEDGIYHWDIVVKFSRNVNGVRAIGVMAANSGSDSVDMGYGWTDVQVGNSELSTYCRVSGNSTSVNRRLSLRALQTSGEDIDIDVRYAYHRIN